MYPYVHSGTTYNRKIQKQPKCLSTDEWIKKMFCVHTHTHSHRVLLSHKKEQNLPSVTTRMDLEGIMLSEINQTERQILYAIIYR